MDQPVAWVNNSIFSWPSYPQTKSPTTYNEWRRAHDLWEHSFSLLSQNPSEFHKIDAISNLKRCLNQRLKFIESLYSLKKIKFNNSPKGYLELLETLNIVRPFMLKQLMLIRNDIEHNDAPPPDLDRCHELIDLVWYFLKSTDPIVSGRHDDFQYEHYSNEDEPTQYGYSLEINFDQNHQIKIAGWFAASDISENKLPNHTKVKVDRLEPKADRWLNSDIHADKLSTDLWLIAELEPSEDIKFLIIKNAINSFW